MQGVASQLRVQLSALQARILGADLSEGSERHALMEAAKGVGEDYLQLEK